MGSPVTKFVLLLLLNIIKYCLLFRNTEYRQLLFKKSLKQN